MQNYLHVYRSCIIVRIVKLRRLQWIGHIIGVRKIREVCKVFGEESSWRPSIRRQAKQMRISLRLILQKCVMRLDVN
jgi:hypothetical protein